MTNPETPDIRQGPTTLGEHVADTLPPGPWREDGYRLYAPAATTGDPRNALIAMEWKHLESGENGAIIGTALALVGREGLAFALRIPSKDMVAALEAVVAERKRQDAKWGRATLRGYSVARWLAVLAEEVGELAGELCFEGADESWYKMREYLMRAGEHARVALGSADPNREGVFEGFDDELVQVAAVAVAIMESQRAPESPGPADTSPVGSPA